ncbi:unnamed protein product [Orchesella dallaii]|uniref:Uncharacterized protein n=1 Tax=Orchesella dallaii TaxID=48710 RepID=A0ABP1RMV8_9HEXA
MEGEQFCEGMGQQLSPTSRPHEEEVNLGDGDNDKNDQLVGESVPILKAAEHYTIPKEEYPGGEMERDALNQKIEERDALIQQIQQQRDELNRGIKQGDASIAAMRQQRDALIHGMQEGKASLQETQRQLNALNYGMQEGDAFNQEMQRQHDALIQQMERQHFALIQQTLEREALDEKIQEREDIHCLILVDQARKISNLENQLKVQINKDDKKCAESERKVETMDTANKSMKKELDEPKEKCGGQKRKLDQNSVHENLQKRIVNSTQVEEQQVNTGSAFMGEEDNAKNYVETPRGEKEALSPLSSSNGSKLSSPSESENAELNDFETMQHFSDSGKSGMEGGKPAKEPMT